MTYSVGLPLYYSRALVEGLQASVLDCLLVLDDQKIEKSNPSGSARERDDDLQ